MSNTKYKALVLGSTGLIGNETLHLLLNNNKYEVLYAISRRELDIENEKLVNIIADFDTIDTKLKDVHIDHFYCCIGSTKSKTPIKADYYKIDLEYPEKVATILFQNGCNTICLVSSIGADTASNNFYLRLKGDVENVITNIGFESTHIFRPSLLLGARRDFRLLERIGQVIYPIVDTLFVGKLKDYKGIKASIVASAMINSALKNNKGVHTYQTQQIKELA